MKSLLHICCGPCSIFPNLKLKGLGILFDALFYNPNITDKKEYNLRLKNARKVGKIYHFNVFEKKDNNYLMLSDITKNNTGCNMCYLKRFDGVFSFAKENNYKSVMTTLLGSPHQNRDLLLKNLNTSSKKYQIPYYDINFKEGFYLGQSLARKNNIYCQKFCGCQKSYHEYLKRKEKITW